VQTLVPILTSHRLAVELAVGQRERNTETKKQREKEKKRKGERRHR
jgi:hypothetical protein